MSKIDKISLNLNSFDDKAKLFIKTQKTQREKETNLFEVPFVFFFNFIKIDDFHRITVKSVLKFIFALSFKLLLLLEQVLFKYGL